MRQRGLILDFGGVISRTMFETHQETERALGLKTGSLTWRGPFDPASDPLWQAMQRGEITERNYWLTRAAELGALIGENWTSMESLVRRARGADPDHIIRPEARWAIERAKTQGCSLAILSNELDLFYGKEFRLRLPMLQQFDVIYDATYTGILKPDQRAYAACLSALGLAKRDCVFVDDQLKNIEGAAAIGLPYVHFDVTSPLASFCAALNQLGMAVTEGDFRA